MSDNSGYDLDDPKHPTYRERMLAKADLKRDEERDSDNGSDAD